MNTEQFVPIRFKNKDKNQFSTTLRKKVNQYFNETGISKKGNAAMHFKTIILIVSFLAPYLIILLVDIPTWAAFPLLTLMGLAYAGLGMAVMHDANHGAYSKSRRVNDALGYVINFIGGNKYGWKIQHNVLHHTYTNIYGLDEDIENGNLFRLSPFSEVKWYHKYQHVYAWFLYSFSTLSWVTSKDFIQLARIKKRGLNTKNDNLTKEFFIMTFTKFIYFGYIFAIPLIFTSYSFWAILLGFAFSHLVAGIVLGVTFQLAHVVEKTQHLDKEEHTEIDRSWSVHEMYTTADFAEKSKFLNWYLGGLNFQIVHHLFPSVCHVHYKKLSDIVKQTAIEFDLPYNEYKTMGNAIQSHYRILKRFGKAKMVQPY